MSQRIVVTGANGQLGRAFQRALPQAKFLDRMGLDLCANPYAIRSRLAELKPSLVINCAAYTAVDQAEQDWSTAFKVNAEGVMAIALGCQGLLPQSVPLIHFSTDYVYGEQPEWREWRNGHSRQEDDRPDPRSAYGWTKLAGEALALQFNPATMVIRTSWLFGEGHNFASTMMRLAKNREVSVVDDQFGRPTYAPDIALAIARMLERYPNPPRGIYNLQNSGPVVSWADFAEEIYRQASLPTKVRRISGAEYAAGRAANDQRTAVRPTNSELDCGKISRVGIELRDWREALGDYLATLP